MTTLNTMEIMARIPHRFPMLLVDRVIELEPGKRGVGIKCVSINEPYFQGHFPDYPIVPGVLIIESLAQLSAIVFAEEAAGARPQVNPLASALAEAAVSAEVAGKVEYAAKTKATPDAETAASAEATTTAETATSTQAPQAATTPQSAGLASLLQAPKNRPGYLAQVDVRFREPVLPGDVMRLEVTLVKKMGRMAKVKAEVRVLDKIVAQGELTFA